MARPGAVDSWRRLAELRGNPFLTPDWYLAWLAAFAAEEPFLITWGRGEAEGLLPLVRVRIGPLKVLRFAGAQRGDWFSPLCPPGREDEMSAACGDLLRRRRDWHLFFLDRIDSGSDTGSAPSWLGALGAGMRTPRRRGREVLPFIGFGGGGYEEYLASRSRNFRSQIGRRRRKLERERGLSFRMTTAESELEEDLSTFFALHEERWRNRGGSSALGADAVKDMHRRFAAAALERGWLRLWTADVDGKPGAAWYGWSIGGRYCYSLSGLSEEYEPFALGTVLLAQTIEHAAEEGAEVYDLMWGDEAYKSRFETGRREVASWVLARRGHPAGPLLAAAEALIGAARRLPPSVRDPLRRIYSSVRARLS